jgi:hypothetical protein
MGRTCSTHGINEKCIRIVGFRGRDHFKDLEIDGIMILEWVLEK